MSSLGFLAQAVVDREKELRWLSMPPAWIVFLVLLPAAGVAAWLLYRREGGELTGQWKLGLGILRFILLAALLCVIFRPTRVSFERKERSAHVLVLLDVSHSMGFSDEWSSYGSDPDAVRVLGPEITAGQARFSRLEAEKRLLLHKGGEWLKALGDKGVLRVFSFNRKGKPLTLEDIPRGKRGRLQEVTSKVRDLNARGPGGEETHIADAIHEAVLSVRGGKIASVVVVSDWQQTGGELSLEDLPERLSLPEGTIPVMAVGIGSPKWPLDTEVVGLSGPDHVLAGEEAQFTATVSARGCEPGVTSRMDFLVNGVSVGKSKYPVFKSKGRRQQVSFKHKFPSQGQFAVSVKVKPFPNEIDESNNKASRKISVEERKIRIIYVESPPRWDYRYLKNFLIRDPSVAIQCLLLSADPDFRQETSLHPLLKPLTHFPHERPELFKYDVIILGDVDPSEFTNQDLANIRAFVAKGGGGVVFEAGEDYNPRAYAHTPLADVLPVEAGTVGGAGSGGAGEGERPFRVQLTPEGRSHPIMQLVPDKERMIDLWENTDGLERNSLPPFWWFAPVKRLKKGAIALAVHPERSHVRYGPRVIFACQIYGRGRSFFSAVDSTWRWRAGAGGKYFERFWGQVIRYAAATRLSGETARFQINVDRPVYSPGEQVTITARILDQELRPSSEKQWEVVLKGPGTAEGGRKIVLTQDDPTRPGSFTAGIEAGSFGAYEVLLGDKAEFRVDNAEAGASFRVVVPAKESRDVRMDEKAAKKIAGSTGGHYYRIGVGRRIGVDRSGGVERSGGGKGSPDGGSVEAKSVLELPGDVSPITQQLQVTMSRRPLWNRWYAIVLVVSLAALEWALRRRRRLV